RWRLAHCGALALISVLLFAGAVFIFSRLGAEFVPQLDEGSVIIQMVRPTSISLDESLAMQIKAEKVIRQEFPEIAGVFSRIGTPEIGTDPMGANLSDTFVFFAPEKRWRRVDGRLITKDELLDSITKML